MAGKPIDEIAICFSFAYNWLRGWCEISEPITDGRKAKPTKAIPGTFNSYIKIALNCTENNISIALVWL